MSDSQEDRLATIIDYLKQQSAVLSTLDRRMGSLDTDVKIISEAMKSIMQRQSELERDSITRLGHYSEAVHTLTTRIFAVERTEQIAAAASAAAAAAVGPSHPMFDLNTLAAAQECVEFEIKKGNGAKKKLHLFITDDLESLCDGEDDAKEKT